MLSLLFRSSGTKCPLVCTAFDAVRPLEAGISELFGVFLAQALMTELNDTVKNHICEAVCSKRIQILLPEKLKKGQ